MRNFLQYLISLKNLICRNGSEKKKIIKNDSLNIGNPKIYRNKIGTKLLVNTN